MAKLRKKTSVAQGASKVMGKHLQKAHASADQLLHKKSKKKEVEAIHDLRVSLRRLGVATQVFAEVLPKGVGKKLARKARKLRQTAGRVRDCDVLCADLDLLRQQGARYEAAASVAAAVALTSRQPLLKKLRAATRDLEEDGFWTWAEREVAKKLETDSKASKASLAELAAKVVPAQLDALWEHLATALDGDDEALHEARIAAKEVRYTLDILGEHLGTEQSRKVYQLVLELQDLLGSIHDMVVFAERCRATAKDPHTNPATRIGLERLATHYRRRRQHQLKAFAAFYHKHAKGIRTN